MTPTASFPLVPTYFLLYFKVWNSPILFLYKSKFLSASSVWISSVNPGSRHTISKHPTVIVVKRGITLIKKNKLWPNLHFYAHLKPSYLTAEIAQYEASWPVTRESRDRYPVNSFSYLSKSIICHFFVLYYHIIEDYYVSLNNSLHSNRFLLYFLKPTVFHQPLYCVIIVITS